MKVKALMRKLFSQVCFFFWIQATVPLFESTGLERVTDPTFTSLVTLNYPL